MQLPVPPQQRLILPLPVNINETGRHLPQLPRRHRLPVDRRNTARRHNLPLDQNRPILLHRKIHLPQTSHLLLRIRLEQQLNQRVLRPVPDHRPVSLRAKRQIDRADDDRLSGARLARQNIQPVREGNLLLRDQRQILHMQTYQHLVPLPSAVLRAAPGY